MLVGGSGSRLNARRPVNSGKGTLKKTAIHLVSVELEITVEVILSGLPQRTALKPEPKTQGIILASDGSQREVIFQMLEDG